MILLALSSCTGNNIKPEISNGNGQADITKPIKWFSAWECGDKKCGERYTITRTFRDGNRVDGGVDFQIQSIYDSTMIYLTYIYSSNDDCELVYADTIKYDSDSAIFLEMNDVRKELSRYDGEVASKSMGLDSPISEIIWGERKNCEMTIIYGKEKRIMNEIIGKYDGIVTKLIAKNDSSSVYEIWKKIKTMANKR